MEPNGLIGVSDIVVKINEVFPLKILIICIECPLKHLSFVIVLKLYDLICQSGSFSYWLNGVITGGNNILMKAWRDLPKLVLKLDHNFSWLNEVGVVH